MKMVMAVVPANSAEHVLDALINKGYTATYAETRGGMLRQSQYSLFIAVKIEHLDEVLGIIRDNCRTKIEMSTQQHEESDLPANKPVTAELGGAVAFIWDMNQIEIF